MDNGFSDAFKMPSGMGGAFSAYSALSALGSTRFVEGPDGTRIVFYEKSNAVDDSVPDVETRMTFTGRFSVDGVDLVAADGKPAVGGLGADFPAEGDPTAAWVWFKQPIDEEMRGKFEGFFGGTFGEDGLRMDVAPEAFLDFADSNSWDADLDDDDPLQFV